MAGNLSNYLENKLVGHSVGVTWTPPGTTYVALFTATPTETGGGTEVSGGSYSRKSLVAPTAWTVTGSTATNASAITFTAASADWGTIEALGLFDASTAGNLLWYGPLNTPRTVTNANVFQIDTGQLALTLE